MSLPNYHQVLVLPRDLKQNEKVKLILNISKTINHVFMNKEDEELCWSDCSGSYIVNNCNKKIVL